MSDAGVPRTCSWSIKWYKVQTNFAHFASTFKLQNKSHLAALEFAVKQFFGRSLKLVGCKTNLSHHLLVFMLNVKEYPWMAPVGRIARVLVNSVGNNYICFRRFEWWGCWLVLVERPFQLECLGQAYLRLILKLERTRLLLAPYFPSHWMK